MEQVTKALLDASQLHSQLTGVPESEDFVKQIKSWGIGIFRLVIMGEIKKGKSSFINALLGVEELVPTSSDVATSTVYKIHYAKEPRYRVFFEPETEKTPLIITAEELAIYGTEKGNPGNEKRVDFIEVAYPAPLLRSGLVIIDTPGLGGLFKEHKKITWQYVPKADAVFFVTDSVESPIGLEEIEHLNMVRKITPHIYFVQTKSAAVDKDDCENRRKNNLSILSKVFKVAPEKIPYFVVDSKRKFQADDNNSMKRLARSGFQELMSFAQQQLIERSHKILAKKSIQLGIPMLKSISNYIETRKTNLAADSAEQQQQVKTDIANAEKELQEWQAHKLPQLQIAINRRIAEIKDEGEDMCAQLRINGEIHSQFESSIFAANDSEELVEIITDLHDRLPIYASECLLSLQKKFQDSVTTLLNSIAQDVNISETSEVTALTIRKDNEITKSHGLQAFSQVMENISDAEGMFNFVQRGSMGLTVGATAGNLIGGILGSIIPGIGNVVGAQLGSLIGAFWGGREALNSQNRQNLKQAKMQAANALSKNISSIHNDMTSTLRKLSSELSNSIGDTIRNALLQRTEVLKKTYSELSERARMNASELATEKTEISKIEAQLRAILKTLEPWQPINKHV